MVHLMRASLAASCALLLAGCLPDVSTDDALVTAPRIVAMRSTPAEALPGATVQWDALYVTPDGDASSASVQWDLCIAREPLADTGPVSTACEGSDPASVVASGTGLSVSGALSNLACQLYGPDPPPAVEGQPPGRPVDADATGGYYEPVVMHTDTTTLGATRISCGVAGADQAQAAAFTRGYHVNENPTISGLLLGPAGAEASVPASGTGTAPAVKAGSVNHLIAQWPVCPAVPICGDGICQAGEDSETCPGDCAKPHGCGGSESYLVFDEATQQIATQWENLHLTWFNTAGMLAEQRGGVEGAAGAPATLDNDWTAPATPGNVTLWVVLVDDRGGSGWQSFTVDVVP